MLDISAIADKPWPWIRGYLTQAIELGDRLDSRSDSFAIGYLSRAVRFDLGAVAKKNCTPGKTIQCGNVCRKPENCKKPSGESKPAATAKAQPNTEPAAAKKTRSPKTTATKPKAATKDKPSAASTKLSVVNFKDAKADFAAWESEAATVRAKIKDDAEFDRLADNSAIRKAIAKSTKPANFRGVRDADGNLQAAIAISKNRDALYVDYLATAPWNVSKSSGDSRAMKGAGTAAIAEVIRESLANKKTKGKVRLNSIPGAEGFYQTLGFKKTTGSYMELSPTDAKAFLDAYDAKRG